MSGAPGIQGCVLIRDRRQTQESREGQEDGGTLEFQSTEPRRPGSVGLGQVRRDSPLRPAARLRTSDLRAVRPFLLFEVTGLWYLARQPHDTGWKVGVYSVREMSWSPGESPGEGWALVMVCPQLRGRHLQGSGARGRSPTVGREAKLLPSPGSTRSRRLWIGDEDQGPGIP